MIEGSLGLLVQKPGFWELPNLIGCDEGGLVVVDLLLVGVVVLGGAGVRGHASVDGLGTTAVVVAGQVEEAGAGGQVDVLDVFHLRSAHRTQLWQRERERERTFKNFLKTHTFPPSLTLTGICPERTSSDSILGPDLLAGSKGS